MATIPLGNQNQGTNLGSYGSADVYGTPAGNYTGNPNGTTYSLPQYGGIDLGYSPGQGYDANIYGTTPGQNQATPWEPTIAAALQAAGVPMGAAAQPNASGGAASPQQPPQLSALMQAMQGGYNPLQPAYLDAPPQQLANLFQGAQLGPTALSSAAQLQPSLVPQFGGAHSGAQTSLGSGLMGSLSPDSTIAQILNGFGAEANHSTRALNDQLASMGVYGGGALGAQQSLQGQLAASLAPTLASAIQNSQANQLGAGEFNVGQGLQQSLANAGFAQQAGLSNQSDLMAALMANLSNQQQTGLANQGALNAANAQQAGLTQQAGLANQNAQNAATENNVRNWIAMQQTNTGYANQAGQNLYNALVNGYGTDLGAFNGINMAGLSGANGLASQGLYGGQNLAGSIANNYPVQTGAGQAFAGLGSALGGLYSPQSQQTNYYNVGGGSPTQTISGGDGSTPTPSPFGFG